MTCEKGSFDTVHVESVISFDLNNVTFTEDSCYHAGEINAIMNNKYYNFACDLTNCTSDSSLDINVFGDSVCTNDITSDMLQLVKEFKVDVSGFECGTCDGQKCSDGGFSLEVAPPVTEAPVVEIGNNGSGDAAGLSTTVLVIIIVAAVGLLACLFAGVWMNNKEKNVEQEQRSKHATNGIHEQNKGSETKKLVSHQEDEVKVFVPTE